MLPEEGDYADLVHRLRLTLLPHLPPDRPEVRPAAAEADQRSQLGFEVSIAVAGIQEAVGLPVACARECGCCRKDQPGLQGSVCCSFCCPHLLRKPRWRHCNGCLKSSTPWQLTQSKTHCPRAKSIVCRA